MLKNPSNPNPAKRHVDPTGQTPLWGADETTPSSEWFSRTQNDAFTIHTVLKRTEEGVFVVKDARRMRLAASMLSATLRELEHGLQPVQLQIVRIAERNFIEKERGS